MTEEEKADARNVFKGSAGVLAMCVLQIIAVPLSDCVMLFACLRFFSCPVPPNSFNGDIAWCVLFVLKEGGLNTSCSTHFQRLGVTLLGTP